ncbi:hypothetical protein [Streptomyces sp. WG7]|uniref:hypothetical protein n=1 Tax=Streptomyces sp. WG7 TaxID=3417650 RepID=UPI003CEABF3F
MHLEATSTRGILLLRNTSGELERLRTDRGDSEVGRAMTERARALTGHRLRVYRLNEQMASNARLQVRTVVHLADYGPDTDPIHENSAKENVLAAAEGDEESARRLARGRPSRHRLGDRTSARWGLGSAACR